MATDNELTDYLTGRLVALQAAFEQAQNAVEAASALRDEFVKEAAEAGLTLRKIGSAVGLSGPRVQQILNRARLQDVVARLAELEVEDAKVAKRLEQTPMFPFAEYQRVSGYCGALGKALWDLRGERNRIANELAGLVEGRRA